MKSYTTNTINEAWNKAAEIMPTDYEYDTYRSNRAGYGIYQSTSEGVDAWVSDLGNRLEVNLPNGESVNVWIEEAETEPENMTAAEAAESVENEQNTDEAAQAMHSVKRMTVNALYAPTVCQRVTICIMGGHLAANDDERRVYEALKRGQPGMESDIIARYCESHGVHWGTISGARAWHVAHTVGGVGHYIVAGFVSARIGYEIEFLQQCAAILSAEYAKCGK